MFSLLRASNPYKIHEFWLRNERGIEVLSFSSFQRNRRRPKTTPVEPPEKKRNIPSTLTGNILTASGNSISF